MKKKIIILGSTGSIGKNTLKVIRKNRKDFEILFLSTNKNIKTILRQAKEFRVKNIIINDNQKYIYAKKKFNKLKINFFNDFKCIDNKLKNKKVFYSMISISGIDGLKPTLKLIKYSKNLAIVNKESLICGWNIIQKKINYFKTNFIPIDSEHYSIYSLLKSHDIKEVEKIFITASGGPFLNLSKNKFNKILVKDALKHPNWKMGKKITIDSATLMNKVFEVIEAKNIFGVAYKKISILTHPKSYLHAIIKFKNGMVKLLIHEPDMKIPIFNSIYPTNNRFMKTNTLDLSILNNLNLKEVDIKKFFLVKLLNKLPKKSSLFETVLVTINDYLVYKFLEKKINFKNLMKLIYKYSNLKEFQKYKKISPKNVDEIYNLRNYVSLKLETLGI